MAEKNKHQEPAQISYFFGESYFDLGRTIKESWIKNGDKIKKSWEEIGSAWSGQTLYKAMCLLILRIATLISVVVFGTIFTAVFSTIHIILLFILMIFVYIGFVVLKFIDFIFCTIKGIGNNCYNPGCERKFMIPIYVCPNCHALHYRLVPSKYGILTRRCNCGEKLPTTFFNGRQKLESLCPHCKSPVIKGAHRSLLIPVVGGANVGKTCYVTMAINQIENSADQLGLNFEYQYVVGDEYKENRNRMSKGMCPEKTGDLAFKYYNFFLSPKNDKIKNLISVCDIAGEVFANQDVMIKQQGYRFADGMIVVVDPLSISEFANKLKKELTSQEFNAINAGTQPIGDVLSGLINTMESLYHIDAKSTIKKSIAVVFTKCDIKGLDERIGEIAIKEYLAQHKNVSFCDASNVLCEKFLSDYGESSFLNTIKGKFSEVQFFACSALGHNNIGKKFISVNVEQPLLWIIDKMSKAIDLSPLWGKKL